MRPLLFALCMLALGACVEPFRFVAGGAGVSIVISGSITDVPGPAVVEVYFSQPADRSKLEKRIKGATVTIYEQDGESEQLIETAPGIYQTINLQGAVGKTYTLGVTTAEGYAYSSTPETMLPVGKFSNLHGEFEQHVTVSADPAQASLRNGFRIYLDAEFDPAQEGRAVWSWAGTYEFRTYPGNNFYLIGKNQIPDPYPCSGAVVRSGVLTQAFTCTCCFCYHTNFNTSPFISDPRLINQDQIKRQYIGFVPADPWYFSNKYFMIVEQRSASEKVYNFWKRVQAASQLGSDLFQTPPAVTVGNISAENSQALPVIGIFSAYAVKTDSLVLTASQIPYELPELKPSLASCADFYRKDNTNIRPPYYSTLP